MSRLIKMFVFVGSMWAGAVWANPSLHPQVEKWIETNQAPFGVVLELISREANFVEKRTPYIQHQVSALKQAFADLDVVIISHGRELNALSNSFVNQPYQQAFEQLHQQGVTVHVCEVVAGWGNKTRDDFPAFIDVAPSGTAQLNDYKKLGYSVIRVP
ncbi:MAG: DsrE family protein [Thiomicrospira sp.]|uniref:DsrE family protein n=1 Tax=Thiomicrospira sp. TaxID=935 RepID=UPI0019F4B8D1|nr:DsrE family protein [Thiomicrospira sp.]MBE0494681.1 DsrE family protein [Thiomicrospira sp.]